MSADDSKSIKVLYSIYNMEWFPLLISAMGMAGLGSELKDNVSIWLIVAALMAWFLVWCLAHLNGTPAIIQNRLCIGVGLYWLCLMLAMESLIFVGVIGRFETFWWCRVLMHVGWLYFVPTAHRHVLIRRALRTATDTQNMTNDDQPEGRR
jgi:hypothetical protein